MQQVTDFLYQLHRKGIRIWKEGDRLCYEALEGSLDIRDREKLRELKQDIMTDRKSVV